LVAKSDATEIDSSSKRGLIYECVPRGFCQHRDGQELTDPVAAGAAGAATLSSSSSEVDTKLKVPPSTPKKAPTNALSPNAEYDNGENGGSNNDSKKKGGNGGGKESTPSSSSSAGKSSSPSAKELKFNVSANTLTPGGRDGGGCGDGGSPEVSAFKRATNLCLPQTPRSASAGVLQ